ncbi:MAG TPA: hypothetical protein VME19_20875 [Streptosporangiaceae bacterium]|nr:hypothetical protein [Streptosporangiaceae bacterium]
MEFATGPDDARHVMSALRLGLYLAEVRGRNRPDGPPGSGARMPKHNDHALPLRIERSPTELRIEAQSVTAALARELRVDEAADGSRFGTDIEAQAKLLAHLRTAARALGQGVDLFKQAPASQPNPGQPASDPLAAVLKLLHKALASQPPAEAQPAPPAAAPNAAPPNAAPPNAAAQDQQGTPNQTGAAVLQAAITALQQAIAADPTTAAEAGLQALETSQKAGTQAAHQAWENLAELLWQFDAHIQDGLTAASETQAAGYQLGRGLAETYWALDPDREDGATGWHFLLGRDRCDELGRLTGRLGAYMGPYTAPAVAGTIVIWQAVAQTPEWRGAGPDAQAALYLQTRRWFELIVLGQDPTTLIKPYQLMTNYRTVLRAFGLFLPQLVATILGLGFLGILLFLLSNNSKVAWAQTLTGILAAVGLSYAGLTGTLKSSAQAMLTRLRQDAYTDLVTLAVETAPRPKKKSQLQQALNRRRLTPVTPN